MPPGGWALACGGVYLPLAGLSALWITYWFGTDVLVTRLVGVAPLLQSIGLGAALGVVVVGTSALTRGVHWFAGMADALAEQFGPLSRREILFVAVFSSVGEEALFRAVLQPAAGLVATSLIFGVVHIPTDRRLWPWPLFAIGMGFVFGGLYQWTGGILAPVVCHFVINAGNLTWVTERPG